MAPRDIFGLKTASWNTPKCLVWCWHITHKLIITPSPSLLTLISNMYSVALSTLPLKILRQPDVQLCKKHNPHSRQQRLVISASELFSWSWSFQWLCIPTSRLYGPVTFWASKVGGFTWLPWIGRAMCIRFKTKVDNVNLTWWSQLQHNETIPWTLTCLEADFPPTHN